MRVLNSLRGKVGFSGLLDQCGPWFEGFERLGRVRVGW